MAETGRRRERERGTLKSTGRSERVESSWGGDGGPADLKKTKVQGHDHLCYTGMSVRNRNLGTLRTTTTKAASVRKQLFMFVVKEDIAGVKVT